ncbi:MAG: 16S rRNA (cytidine(1402)-2'-O)-methyltransferase [Cyanobacteria bacterium P01_D01_bin.128]
MSLEPCPGTLYLVGTPIGNLEDITARAIRILQSVDLIAAEDTRHTAKLLHHFQITTPQISHHQHNQAQRIPELIGRLNQGQSLALVTDAGMPGISDPGAALVRSCWQAEHTVVPIPGPTAAISALVASGLPTERFVFEGFLPIKGKARRQRLEEIQSEPRTIVLYEAPHRLLATLMDLTTVLGGDRATTLARELTKRHEEFWRGTLQGACEYYQAIAPKGEFTLVLAGTEREQPQLSKAALKTELQALIEQGLSRSQASRQLAHQTQLSRRELYQLALSLDEE